ncbi:MAG TPA: serine/threonine-protein kinase [Pirellulaceae bacterium]|nr:serine/threonine-protein kinase [Pirellulaceae bacterium]
MNDRNPKTSLGPADITLDAPSSDPDQTAPYISGKCRVHLVQGSGSQPSGELNELLRSRLRSAALLMFGGFAIFLVWHIFMFEPTTTLPIVTFVAHVLVTMVLGAIGFSLCSQCRMTSGQLRAVELITFATPVTFFMLMQHGDVVRSVIVQRQMHPDLSAMWLLVIYTYALFIPNDWRRAAVVLTIVALAPVITTVFTAVLHPQVLEAMLADKAAGVATVLELGLACVGAVWGVYIINHLQHEAYEARQIGQYRLKQLLGAGGMGEVYLAEHQLMKRPCAIKLIRPEKAGDPKVLARFEREVHATAKLSHWNNIDIFDYGRADDGTFYYVMEYLPGMNLGEIVRRFGPMPPARAIHLVRQACDALQEAHDVGLMHRDLKPANLFAAVRGGFYDVAKLLDFGLAKPLTSLDSASLTADGTITGSPLYMSPEQATGDREPDARSDIYAMGALLYFLVSGRPPFENEKPIKVLISHAHEPVLPPSKWRDDLPLDLESVIMRCLAKSPDERYQSAAELATALDDCESAGYWTRDDARRWWQEKDPVTATPSEMAMG